MSPVTDVPITKLADGIRLALENARRLAVASADATESRAAAILLYQAAEEVGKAKLLKDATQPVPTAPGSTFLSHRRKFDLAKQVVPSDCLELWRGMFDPAIFDPAIFDHEPGRVDPQRREDSLYLNWDATAGDWVVPAVPEPEVVKASATRMVAFIDGALASGLR